MFGMATFILALITSLSSQTFRFRVIYEKLIRHYANNREVVKMVEFDKYGALDASFCYFNHMCSQP